MCPIGKTANKGSVIYNAAWYLKCTARHLVQVHVAVKESKPIVSNKMQRRTAFFCLGLSRLRES